jgi:transketolase
MFAGQRKIAGLTAIVDYNRVQLSETVPNILDLEPLADKWKAFGWRVLECDGHDVAAVVDTLEAAREDVSTGPTVVIAHTVKGKGVSFMEGRHQWHGRAPNDEQRREALAEIERCTIQE